MINRMYLHSYDFFIFFILTILFILSKKGNSYAIKLLQEIKCLLIPSNPQGNRGKNQNYRSLSKKEDERI